jgi:protein-S-isoprenylcysteine O-methyltransferase Ste14
MQYLVLAVLWITWCVLHSAMISMSVTDYLKRRLGITFRFYRFTFNMAALLTLVPVAMYERSIDGHWAFWWQGSNVFFQIMLLAAAFLLFFAGARHYDFLQFVGFRQIRGGASGTTLGKADDLDTTGILGIIRHPWYTGSIIIIWARDLMAATVVTNIILTSYLIVGAYLEERKLVIKYGQRYRTYQQKVPMFIPCKFSKSKTEKEGRH